MDSPPLFGLAAGKLWEKITKIKTSSEPRPKAKEKRGPGLEEEFADASQQTRNRLGKKKKKKELIVPSLMA